MDSVYLLSDLQKKKNHVLLVCLLVGYPFKMYPQIFFKLAISMDTRVPENI